MPNSATLVQALGAAFCAILCAFLYPLSELGGGGMRSGARTAAWAKSGGWKNPYVTDGLVAMWDGEWNAGGGKHDPNRTWPIELINGIEHDSDHDFGTPVVGSNFFSIAKGESFAYKIPNIENIIGVSSGEFTIENVCDLNTSGSLKSYIQNIGDPSLKADTSCAAIGFQDNYFQVQRYNLGGVNRASKQYKNRTHGVSASISEKELSVHVNGLIQDTRVFGYESSRHGDYIRFGVPLENRHVGKYFSARIYSRIISEQEIAANYAIDKVRFNLT